MLLGVVAQQGGEASMMSPTPADDPAAITRPEAAAREQGQGPSGSYDGHELEFSDYRFE